MKEKELSDVTEATERLFREAGKFVIIGLTGRTGSGCSMTARLLSEVIPHIPQASNIYDTDNDKRKYEIVKGYVQKNWKPFTVIQMRAIITGILLELDFDRFKALLSKILKIGGADLTNKLADFESDYRVFHCTISAYKSLPEENAQEINHKKEDASRIYFDVLPTACARIKSVLQDKLGAGAYTALYQKVGDNIRASGVADDEKFNPDKIFTLSKIANQLIKVVRSRDETGSAFVVLDAIRNPFEAVFFQQRYANFYLISINTPNEERLKHLRGSHKFSEQQIEALDKKEYPKKLSGKDIYTSQNIQKCIEISDIHINNPHREPFNTNDLSSQLLWYISLITHPGLITPTSMERGMQIAYSAKLNSGCISRQVGAVVTDSTYSVKAVGWNSTPEGQTPCILRSATALLKGGEEFVYSSYERQNVEFHKVMEHTFTRDVINSNALKGRPLPYCFKDIQNEVEDEKNQVHTRSLHAEENAFLQIAKYGGQAIKGGILFTTASPCELCSKKAYQLGIEKVVYIDPYPGISRVHILDTGSNAPDLILFRGSIGRAYHRLYMPLLPIKDELRMLTGFSIGGGKIAEGREARILALEKENDELRARLAAVEARRE